MQQRRPPSSPFQRRARSPYAPLDDATAWKRVDYHPTTLGFARILCEATILIHRSRKLVAARFAQVTAKRNQRSRNKIEEWISLIMSGNILNG